MTHGIVAEDLAAIAHRLADEGYALVTGLFGDAELALARASHAVDGRAAEELARTRLRTLSDGLRALPDGRRPSGEQGGLRLAVVLAGPVAPGAPPTGRPPYASAPTCRRDTRSSSTHGGYGWRARGRPTGPCA
ncbi:hypothetical protein [Streptomyces sp. sk2.1]|uniref:hypothetical protein n=1 Tax=Streptomyces sp. sk2.1 TaxID=2478959 RepID=UPI0011E6CA9F|nr:hypothetical protein [Streptomyces sp. sk2.1]TXS71340.1 hypothetical protein EAO76_21675 [Streptomyces sp. sk2.1]